MLITYHWDSRYPFWISASHYDSTCRKIKNWLETSAYQAKQDYLIPKYGHYVRISEPAWRELETAIWQHRVVYEFPARKMIEVMKWLEQNIYPHNFAVGPGRQSPWQRTYYFHNYSDFVQFTLTWT